MRNEKGITLISLVASIMLIFIIAGITITTSVNSFNQMKFNSAKAEIDEVQKLVDEIASDYDTYAIEIKGDASTGTYQSYFKERYNADFVVLKNMTNRSSELEALMEAYPNLSTSDSAFLFTTQDLNKYFNLKGINDVVVDFTTRTVYSVKGIKDPDNGKIYHQQAEWDNDPKVDYTTRPNNKKFSVIEIGNYGTQLNLELVIARKVEDISEIYYYFKTQENANGSYSAPQKIEDFQIVECKEGSTRIRLTVNGKGIYKFKVITLAKDEFESNDIDLDFVFFATPLKDINFPRTSDTKDFDNILTTVSEEMSIKISNNEEAKYSAFDTTYEISIADTSKYDFENGGKIIKEIHGNGEQEETVSFKLKIKDLTNRAKEVKIRITATEPYSKTVELTIKVTQEGAIQSIEDLVDLSKNVKKSGSDAISQRFKMTRDLDFKNRDSYDNPDRTDYGDANGDNTTKGNLYKEMTEGSGFMPIGNNTYMFKGCFNGGNHTLSNLLINRKDIENVGLFSTESGATIKNITVAKANVTQANKTGGIILGKGQGGTLDNVNTDANSKITVTGTNATTADNYGAGIVGFIEKNGKINNCTNKATVTTSFTNGDKKKYSGPAAGICAWMAHSTITNCSNYGNITGEKYVAGIAGFAGMHNTGSTTGGGSIKSCENHGNISINSGITSTEDAYNGPGCLIGGIAGYLKSGATIESCTNYDKTKISGIGSVGGVLGGNYGGTVKNCTNKSAKTNFTSTSEKGLR